MSMAPPTKLKQSSMESFLKSATTTSPSDYERLRHETIRRNQDFLRKLGIRSIDSLPKPLPKSKSIPKPSPISPTPLRRSARNRGLPPILPSPDPIPHRNETLIQPSSHLDFADSSVFQYVCNSPASSPSLPPSPPSNPIFGFEIVGNAFCDPSLSRIYTIDVRYLKDRRLLVAAGGHGGFISVYGGGGGEEIQEDTEGPLMSWKGSRSWISRVMFAENDPMLLISSSNDGKIVFWDIKKQPVLSPSSSLQSWTHPVVVELAGLHSGGIFSMDQLDGSVATASKDSSVGVCKITASGELVVERNITGHHSGAIRGVCFGDVNNRLADCGADGRICILDTRLPQPCSLTFATQHSTGVNTVDWCRANNFLLLSASNDPTLLLYDIRSPAEPLHKLEGHVESNSRTCSRIYRPCFVDGGKAVATPGQGSRKLSLYNIDKGTLMSKGLIGYDANLVMFTNEEAEHPRLWAAGKQINELRPLPHPPADSG